MKVIVAVVAFAVSQTQGTAADDQISCPEKISAESRVLAPPPSWEVRYEGTEAQLKAVGFYDGPPSEGASLVYDKESHNRKTTTASWHFPANDGRGYWVSCAYSDTSAVLIKKLASTISQCDVAYARDVSIDGLPAIQSIHCK